MLVDEISTPKKEWDMVGVLMPKVVCLVNGVSSDPLVHGSISERENQSVSDFTSAPISRGTLVH